MINLFGPNYSIEYEEMGNGMFNHPDYFFFGFYSAKGCGNGNGGIETRGNGKGDGWENIEGTNYALNDRTTRKLIREFKCLDSMD